MSGDPYSDEVRRLFDAPVHAGEFVDGEEAFVSDQGVRVRLTMQVHDGRIDGLRFQAWGCPHLIAAAEAVCAAYEGREVVELTRFKAAQIIRTLAIPVEKTGRILVLEDAARSLGQAPRADTD